MTIGWDDVRRALASRSPVLVAEPVQSRAAVALVLRDGARGLELLFIRRAEHPEDLWSGQMAFPGGRAEPEDADLKATAIRETQEEVGLDLASDGECLGQLDEQAAMARMRPLSLAITPYVFRLNRSDAAIRPGPEVTSVHWIAIDDLRGPERRSTTEYVHDDIVIEFPCIRVESLVIWGLTYRMFVNFDAALSALAGGVTGDPRVVR